MTATATAHDPSMEPLKAMVLILSAMVLFSVMDALGKFMADGYPASQVVWGRYLFFIACLLPFLLRRGGVALLTARRPGLQIVRGVTMMLSALLFVSALASLPLAQATVIAFASPFFTTLLSIPLLGETVRARRWAATIVGFCGVLVIIRPGTEAFHPAMVLPVCSALLWSFGLIATRKMGHDDAPLTTLLYTAFIGFVGTSAVVWRDWVAPDAIGWGAMAAMGILNTAGQFLLIAAFQRAPASLLAPFSYSTMVWAALFGFLFWHAVPDRFTWAGAAIIVASGLYIWHRERVLYRPVIVPNAAISGAEPAE